MNVKCRENLPQIKGHCFGHCFGGCKKRGKERIIRVSVTGLLIDHDQESMNGNAESVN